MKKKTRKLTLHRETLHSLVYVSGGGPTGRTDCWTGCATNCGGECRTDDTGSGDPTIFATCGACSDGCATGGACTVSCP